MIHRTKKTEKGAARSSLGQKESRFGARSFASPETEKQNQPGLCGPLCNVNLMDLPLQAKAVPNRTGMPNQLKAGIESLSGMDMSDVRVHANSDKPAQLNALAYAQRHDIHLAPGQERHLPHEAWHVVQQKMGMVRPTLQAKGVGINDDPGLEQEADRMSRNVNVWSVEDGVRNERLLANDLLLFNSFCMTSQAPIQRVKDFLDEDYDESDDICDEEDDELDPEAAEYLYDRKAHRLTLGDFMPEPPQRNRLSSIEEFAGARNASRNAKTETYNKIGRKNSLMRSSGIIEWRGAKDKIFSAYGQRPLNEPIQENIQQSVVRAVAEEPVVEAAAAEKQFEAFSEEEQSEALQAGDPSEALQAEVPHLFLGRSHSTNDGRRIVSHKSGKALQHDPGISKAKDRKRERFLSEMLQNSRNKREEKEKKDKKDKKEKKRKK